MPRKSSRSGSTNSISRCHTRSVRPASFSHHQQHAHPPSPQVPLRGPSHHKACVSGIAFLGCIYNWFILLFLALLVFSQLFGIFWNVVASRPHLLYGRSPLLGKYLIDGNNDEPFADRSLVCIRYGKVYLPVQLTNALESSKSTVIDTTGQSVHGYRTITRSNGLKTIDPATLNHYADNCNLIASTIDPILRSCRALGYNVTEDNLRIVNGHKSNTVMLITDSLPVLIVPFWDNAIFARYYIPGWDGSTCLFRLAGKFEDSTQDKAILAGVDRQIREVRTAELLKISDGAWRNGWYESAESDEKSATKWHADVISTKYDNEFQAFNRQFDLLNDKELDCVNTKDCAGIPATEHWGKTLGIVETVEWFTGVVITNGERFGLFTYESVHYRVVTSVYDLAAFISDASVELVLFRWLVAQFAILKGFVRFRMEPLQSSGIGCISGDCNFTLLTILLLPRLKMLLAAFWTIGCEFEGEQKSLAEAWFIIYPALAEFMLFLYSWLNLIAKLLRRRVSDAFFGPTLLIFCLMHRLRHELSQSGLLGIDGRTQTLVLSDEFEKMSVIDFFYTDTALRMSGNVTSIFSFKLAVVAVNLIGTFMFSDTATLPAGQLSVEIFTPFVVEHELNVRAATTGGLGRVHNFHRKKKIFSDFKSGCSSPLSLRLSGYELCRLGYLVFGNDAYLISFRDWVMILLFSPFRFTRGFVNAHVLVYPIEPFQARISIRKPLFISLDDERIRRIPTWQIAVHSFDKDYQFDSIGVIYQ